MSISKEVKVAHEIVKQNDAEFQEQFGALISDLPADTHSLILMSRACANRTAEVVYDHGRVLIALRQQLEHGKFDAHVEELGLGRAWAYAAMKFSTNCHQLTAVSNGKIDLNKIKKLGQSKAILLVSAALENPEELANNGTIRGTKVDEYDALSFRELKTKLRAHDKTIADGTEQLQKLKDKNHDLHIELKNLSEGSEDHVAATCSNLLRDFTDIVRKFEATVTIEPTDLGEGTLFLLTSVRTAARASALRIADLVDEHYPDAANLDIEHQAFADPYIPVQTDIDDNTQSTPVHDVHQVHDATPVATKTKKAKK